MFGQLSGKGKLVVGAGLLSLSVSGLAGAAVTVAPAAFADVAGCIQVAYKAGPWGPWNGIYMSCQDEQGNHLQPPAGTIDAWDYMHRDRSGNNSSNYYQNPYYPQRPW